MNITITTCVPLSRNVLLSIPKAVFRIGAQPSHVTVERHRDVSNHLCHSQLLPRKQIVVSDDSPCPDSSFQPGDLAGSREQWSPHRRPNLAGGLDGQGSQPARAAGLWVSSAHDVSGQDVVLTGNSVWSRDPLTPSRDHGRPAEGPGL